VSGITTGDALAYCARLRDLILLHNGGWADADGLYRFHLLAGAAARAADDAQCGELLRSAEQYAKDLFSATAHHSWARGKTSGADILRLCILGKLDTLRDRLTQLYGQSEWANDLDASRNPSRE
jgi:hypothetical protein